MMYNWSHIPEDDIYSYLDALGVAEYRDAIKWLLTNKARLDAEININIGIFASENSTQNEKGHALDRLKVGLFVCNRTQAIKIL